MRKILAIIGVMLAIALVTPTLALASNHREGPRVVTEPTADNTDVLSFAAPLTVVSVAALLVPLRRGRDDHEDPLDD